MSTDVLKLLPPLMWRGINYPIISRDVGFAHESVQHKLERRNEDLVEQTGARNMTFSYTFPMREGLFKGPYKSMFIEGLRKLLADCRNKTPGILVDPVYGEYRCVPASYQDGMDLGKRDGTDIKVEFLHSPEEGASSAPEMPTIRKTIIEGINTTDEAAKLAEVAGTPAAAKVVLTKPKEPGNDGQTDLLSAINGVYRQGLNVAERLNAIIENEVFRLRKLEDTANELIGPNAWIVRRSSRLARDSASALKSQSFSPVPVRVVVNASPRSVTSLAATLGISVADLIRANPSLSRSPIVRAGTNVIIPQK